MQQNIEYVDPKTLKQHPQNPRKGDSAGIAESIREVGFYGAVVAQVGTRHLLIGNHRAMAAIEAGLEEIPVGWLDCDDDTALRIMLKDNRMSDLASYDNVALQDLLSELAETPLHLDGTGYDMSFLEEIYASNKQAAMFGQLDALVGNPDESGTGGKGDGANPLSHGDSEGSRFSKDGTDAVQKSVILLTTEEMKEFTMLSKKAREVFQLENTSLAVFFALREWGNSRA